MKRPTTLDARHVALAKGTRVVLVADVAARDGWICKAGSMGRVSVSAHPHYVVQTPAGHTLDVVRSGLVIQHERARDTAVRREDDWARLRDTVVLEVTVGSVAWNLADEHSDEDVRGAFLLPWTERAGLFEPPDELHPPSAEAQYWEVGKLIRNGLRGEANVLEALWTPHVRRESRVGRMLRERRDIFASRRVHGSFGRYAISQFEKLRRKMAATEIERWVIETTRNHPRLPKVELVKLGVQAGLGDERQVEQRFRQSAHAHFDRGLITTRRIEELLTYLREHGTPPAPYRPKNAYNLLRLMHSGIHWLRFGTPLIAIEEGRPDGLRERLLTIKRGEAPLDDVVRDAKLLAGELDEALETSVLPEEPDIRAADALLRACREVAARRHFSVG